MLFGWNPVSGLAAFNSFLYCSHQVRFCGPLTQAAMSISFYIRAQRLYDMERFTYQQLQIERVQQAKSRGMLDMWQWLS